MSPASRLVLFGLCAVVAACNRLSLEEGGVELVYRFDVPPASMERTVEVLSDRLDPYGKIEGLVTARGDEVVVRVPWGMLEDEEGVVRASSADPTSDERILPVRRRIESVGGLVFALEASAFGVDSTAERMRLMAWSEANPDAGGLAAYNRIAHEDGGPPTGFAWFPMRGDPAHEAPPPQLVRVDEERPFTEADLEAVHPSQDELGYPSLAFELRDERKEAFGDFTAAHVHDGLAILVDDVIVTLATINERLPGEGIINGGRRGFESDEVNDLVAWMRFGRLESRPELVRASTFGRH